MRFRLNKPLFFKLSLNLYAIVVSSPDGENEELSDEKSEEI